MRYTPELVLKVNEVFHDVEGSAYAGVHPEIFQGETARWDEIARTEIAPRQDLLRLYPVPGLHVRGVGPPASGTVPELRRGRRFGCRSGWIGGSGLLCYCAAH